MALVNPPGGIVSPISALRMEISDGRTSPARNAMAKTWLGVRVSVSPKIIIATARLAYVARIMHITARRPIRSPATPNSGAISVPRKCSDPIRASETTESVSTSTYQPRMSVSISNAQEVSRSAGH